MEAKLIRRFGERALVVKTRWISIIIGSVGHLLEPALTLYTKGRMLKILFESRSLVTGIRFSFGERMPHGAPIWEIKILTPKMAREDPYLIWAF
jgi:hypothetical protein